MSYASVIVVGLSLLSAPALSMKNTPPPLLDPSDAEDVADKALSEVPGPSAYPDAAEPMEAGAPLTPGSVDTADRALGRVVGGNAPHPVVSTPALAALTGGMVGGAGTTALAAGMVMSAGVVMASALSCCSTPKWVESVATVGIFAVPLILPMMLALPPIAIALAMAWSDAGSFGTMAATGAGALTFVLLTPVIAGSIAFGSIYSGLAIGAIASPLGSTVSGLAGAGAMATSVAAVSAIAGIVIGGVAWGGATMGSSLDDALTALESASDHDPEGQE